MSILCLFMHVILCLKIRAIHTEHELSLDKLMACVRKPNLVSPKKFSHEDLTEITKRTQFSRAVREER